MKKIGIMGGTFNPIHYGHLFLAENSCEQVGLDKILFMPSKNPPHKSIAGDVTEQQRADMIALAISGNPNFEFSAAELERDGVTYTADTLSFLAKQHTDTEYYFIVGADSLFYMHNWMEPQTIFNLCSIVAASRNHVDQDKLKEQSAFLKNNFGARIILIDMPTIQISSETIRERIAAHKSVRYYLPDSVVEYIIKNKLYTAKPEVVS